MSTAERNHPGGIKRAFRTFAPRSGERVAAYSGRDEALIDAGHGVGKTRVESLLPLRAHRPGEAPAPVDLTLREQGLGWSPINPFVDTRIDRRLGDGVSFPGILRAAPIGDADVEAALSDGKPFWANVAPDTDYFLRTEPSGAEAFWQLRSEDSPEELRLKLDLPAGVEARVNPDAHSLGEIQIRRGSELLATVSPSHTVDADQEPVSTKTRLEGDTVVITVDHRGHDLAYPLLVDPTIAVTEKYWGFTDGNHDWNDFDGWYWYTPNPLASADGSWMWTPYYFGAFPDWYHRWNLCHNDPGCDGGYGRGLYNVGNTSYMAAGDYGEWVFWAGNAGQINLERAELYDRYDFAGCLTSNPCSLLSAQGIGNYNGWVSVWGSWGSYDGNYKTYCTPYTCDISTNGQYANAAIEQLYGWDDGNPYYPVNYLRSGYVVLTDAWAPTGLSVSHSNLPSGWVRDASPSVAVSASDTGVGVKRFRLYRQLGGGPRQLIAENANPCQGNRHGWCPASWSTSFGYGTQGLAEGDYTFSVDALDAWDNATTSQSWHVKVDRTLPSPLDVMGRLRGMEPGHAYDEKTAELDVNAFDYDAGRPTSGVKRLEVFIDNNDPDPSQLRYEATCPDDACALDHTFAIDTSGLTGTHQFKVTATDSADNQRSDTWSVDFAMRDDTPRCTTNPVLPVLAPLTSPTVSASDVESSLSQHFPQVLAPGTQVTTIADETVQPALAASGAGFKTTGSLAEQLLPTRNDTSIVLGSGRTAVCVSPFTTGSSAGLGTLTSNHALAIYPNTAPAVDSLVRATAVGVETFDHIRGIDAPEQYVWQFALHDDQRLEQLSDGSVAVVVGPPPGDPPPADPDTTGDASDLPGSDPPDPSEYPPANPGDPAPPDTDAGPIPARQLADIPDSAKQIDVGQTRLSNAAAVAQGRAVVAILAAPWAVDANGARLPTSMTVAGSTVVISVSHRTPGTAYPVLLDPDFEDCAHDGQPCGTYRPEGAVKFAHGNWNLRKRGLYPVYDNDCTNFVNLSLHAGGMQFMREFGKGYGSWWGRRYSGGGQDSTESWRLAYVMYDQLVRFHLAQKISLSAPWRPGDLLYYNTFANGPKLDHVQLVTKVDSNGQPYMTQHSKDYSDRSFTRIFNDQSANVGPYRKAWSLWRLRPVHTSHNIPESQR